jgi:hypothetical protein
MSWATQVSSKSGGLASHVGDVLVDELRGIDQNYSKHVSAADRDGNTKCESREVIGCTRKGPFKILE